MPRDGKSVGSQQQHESPREPHDAAGAPMQAANGGEQALGMALLLCNAMCQVLPAGRSQPLAYVWPLASRCKRKCCAVKIDEVLLQEAVRAHHQHCLRLDSRAQGGCVQQKFPNKDQLHTVSS